MPSLRNLALTAPYMHDGSAATLRDVLRHYSELNEERLHADGERILVPLQLNAAGDRGPAGLSGQPERSAGVATMNPTSHFGARPMNIRRFGILLFPGVEELDFVGPWEMLRMWSLYADGPRECLLVAQHEAPVECAKGMRVLPHCDFSACPPLDALLVPGGQGTRQEVDNPVLVDFVRPRRRSPRW